MNRGRKRDEVRDHFSSSGKISHCNYCNKRFSSPVTLALKGHLAGNGFSRIQKTTSCPSVPMDVKEYYIYHMMTRKRYTKKRNIDDMMMSGRAHSPTSDCTSVTSKEENDGMCKISKMSTDSDINISNDDTHSSDTSVTSSPARNINDYIDDQDYDEDDEYSQYLSLCNHLHFDAKAMNADHTFFNFNDMI
jgi:hypothetical protein